MIQGGELILILLLALIVLGPRRLPEIARKLGQWTAELRASAREITKGLESEVAQLKQPLDDLKAPLKEIEGDLREANPARYDWKGPKPVSGPTPEDAMADLDEIEGAAPDDTKEPE